MSWHRHVMANVAWSHNNWTDVEPSSPDLRFGWVQEHPDDHADAWLFNWAYLEEYGGYVPIQIPRLYAGPFNGEGLLFVSSLNPSDKRYYIIGCFAACEFDLDAGGGFTADLNNSVRFAVHVPLVMKRHCPLLKDGTARTKTFGQNNFNYIRDDWALQILKEAQALDYLNDDPEPEWCTYSGEPAAEAIERLLGMYF